MGKGENTFIYIDLGIQILRFFHKDSFIQRTMKKEMQHHFYKDSKQSGYSMLKIYGKYNDYMTIKLMLPRNFR